MLSRIIVKPPFSRVFTSIILLSLFIFQSSSFAAQNNNKEQSSSSNMANSPIAKNDFEWQFMVDISLVDSTDIYSDQAEVKELGNFQLGLLLDVSYKGFFIQTNSRRSSTVIGGAELGYQVSVQDDWQLDLIIKTYIDGFEPNDQTQDQSLPQVNKLKERGAASGIALRYSHYFEDAIFYTDIARVYAGDDENEANSTGLIIDSFYSHLIPYRNWDIYVGIGLTYYDQAVVDYYFGIDADEVSVNRPLFTADSSFRAQLELFAQYPLSQSWSFNTGLSHSYYSSSLKRSPIINKNQLTKIMLGVRYVF